MDLVLSPRDNFTMSGLQCHMLPRCKAAPNAKYADPLQCMSTTLLVPGSATSSTFYGS